MRRRVLFALVIWLGFGSAAALSDPLSDCAGILAGYTPVVGTDPYPVPAGVALPAVREAWRDPAFGTCVVRVTDRLADFDTPQTGLKNEYSRVQAFNADESLIMVRGVDGDWFLYDAHTLEPIQRLAFSLDEPRWDAQNPLRFSYTVWFDGIPQLMAVDLTPRAGGFEVTTSVAHDFTGELPPAWNATFVWRRWEGSPSADGRYDAFLVEDPDFVTRGLITYDWQTGAILGRYTVPHGELNEPDSVSISPLGDYVLAQFEFCESGTMGTYEEPCGAMIYTRDLLDGWGITRIIGHSDLALDAQGREVLVYQGIDTDQIVMTGLADGETTPLLGLDFSTGVYGLHISGQAFNRPGWAAVSVHPEAPSLDFSNPFWMVGTVFAVELKADPRVVRLAFHHSIRSETEADYFAEPQVTTNRDFTRLLFTSNWEHYGAGEVDMYLIVLPDDWTEKLP
jgi:hypothetical protein